MKPARLDQVLRHYRQQKQGVSRGCYQASRRIEAIRYYFVCGIKYYLVEIAHAHTFARVSDGLAVAFFRSQVFHIRMHEDLE